LPDLTVNVYFFSLCSKSECRTLRWRPSYYNWDIESSLQSLQREGSRKSKLDFAISEYNLHAAVPG
jgi:hypothetical protein